MKHIVLLIVLIAFLGLTALAIFDHGYVDIFLKQLENYAGMQVLVDLIIALSLFIAWMWQDSKKNNRNPLPWIFLILATGSIGALLYLIVYKTKQSE